MSLTISLSGNNVTLGCDNYIADFTLSKDNALFNIHNYFIPIIADLGYTTYQQSFSITAYGIDSNGVSRTETFSSTSYGTGVNINYSNGYLKFAYGSGSLLWNTIYTISISVNAIAIQNYSLVSIVNNTQNFTIIDDKFYADVYSYGFMYANGEITQTPSLVTDTSETVNATIFYTHINDSLVELARFLMNATKMANVTSITLSGTATTSVLSITNNLTNATIDNLYFDTTTTNNYEITANSGYTFNTLPYLRITIAGVNTDLSFTENQGVYTLSVDATQYQNVDSISVNGVAEYIPLTKNVNITQYANNISFTQNSDTSINDVSTTYHFEIKIDNGYYLVSNNMRLYFMKNISNPYEYYTTFTYDSTNDVYVCNFTIEDLPADFYSMQSGYYPYVLAECATINPLISDYGCIRAYSPTKNQLKSIVNKRFFNVDTNQYEDLGEYIISFVRYPFSISTSGSETVKFGFFDTQINVALAENQVYTLSLGKTTINGLYENSSDINNARIIINLPYCDNIELDSKYINTDIEIIYKVDILANTCVIEIYSDDNLIDTHNTSIGYDIPYILKTERIRPVNIDLQSNILKIKDPKILVFQKPKVSDTFNNTLKRCNLENISGYIVADNIELNVTSNMTLAEQDLIKNQLKAGVYI